MEQKVCSCQRQITRITATHGFNAAFEGGALNTSVVGWEYILTGCCGNGCQAVNLGRVKHLCIIPALFPYVVNVDVNREN